MLISPKLQKLILITIIILTSFLSVTVQISAIEISENHSQASIGEQNLSLLDAIVAGDILLVRTLISDPGFTYDEKQNSKTSPLHAAVEHGQQNILELLLDSKKFDINLKKGEKELTPLHIAVSLGSILAVEILLDNNPNLEAEDTLGAPPLLSILENQEKLNKVQILELLIKAGADINSKSLGYSFLHCAVAIQDVDLVKQILKYDPDLEVRESKANATPLHFAAVNNHVEILVMLLEKGANPEARLINGLTTLHIAAEHGSIEMVEAILKKNVDITARDVHGRTVLHFAVANKKPDSADIIHRIANTSTFLVNNNTNWSVVDTFGSMPFMVAEYLSSPSAELLREKSGDAGKMWLSEKLLAHRFGISGSVSVNGTTADLEGLISSVTYKEMLTSFNKISKSESLPLSSIWTREDLNQVSLILKNCLKIFSTADPVERTQIFMQNLKNDKVAILPTVWMNSPGGSKHATAIVMTDRHLLKCNRDILDKELQPGIEIFQLNSPANTQSAIEMVVTAQLEESLETQKHFNETINSVLDLQKLGTLAHKNQTVGNCTWASAKISLRAVLYEIALAKGLPEEVAAKESYKLYKDWSIRDRILALEEFAHLSKNIQIFDKTTLGEKLEKKLMHKPWNLQSDNGEKLESVEYQIRVKDLHKEIFG